MNDFFSPLKRLLCQFLFVMGCFWFSRCLFTLINLHHFEGLTLIKFIAISVEAVRFDISAFCALNSLYVFLLLFPYKGTQTESWDRFTQAVFVSVNTLAFLFEISDWAYFPYNHKRATADVLDLITRKGDFRNQLPGLLADYWYVALSAVLFVALFVWANRRICFLTPLAQSGLRGRLIRFFLMAAVFVIGIRGGLQLVPVGIRNVVESVESQYAPIVLNTPFSIITTLQNNRLEEERYFDDPTLKHLINTTKHYATKPFYKKNIVLIVLESFSKEFTGIGGMKSYTPFLDSLMQASFVCTNAFANGNRSAEAIPAIIAGIPSLQEEPFTTSRYGLNTITSIPHLLKRKGYGSAFYHGGTNGTMSFDLFSVTAGFDRYVGRNEYPDPGDFDGRWGIWDEPFLKFALQDMGTLKQPFFASVFSLSSHQPFAIPEQYKGRFPKGTLPVHETIGYTDNALRLFFEEASQKPWYTNTLFVLVADHCFPLSDDDYYHYHQGRFAVPLIYYAPGDTSLNAKTTEVLTQQIDILPSIMDYIGYPDSFFAFGNSVFSEAPYRFSIQRWSTDLLWTKDNYFLRVANKEANGFFDVKDKLCRYNLLQEKDSLAASSMKYLQAFRQIYSQSMIYNRLWIQ